MRICAFLLLASLAACGGGGSSGAEDSTPAPAEVVQGIRDTLGREIRLDFCSSPEYGTIAGDKFVEFLSQRHVDIFLAAGGKCDVMMFGNMVG